ncbi:hypothetical protein ACFJIV_12175 [Mucilaginibacter sp. UC70_90]
MNVPVQTSGSGPLGSTNSLLTFTSGAPVTAIQEIWGLNLCGTNVQPVKVYNASLLVGLQSNNQDYGTGNIFATGNVGIGTTDTKGYKLGVNGSVIATSVTVKLNSAWPDYVFKSAYQLPSLTEVKSYIDQNQHLPEIPSAEEVEKNGQNLGEMNKLLMKKVEELTLYAIENEQKDKEKDKLLTSLQEQINLLKQQLTAITGNAKH